MGSITDVSAANPLPILRVLDALYALKAAPHECLRCHGQQAHIEQARRIGVVRAGVAVVQRGNPDRAAQVFVAPSANGPEAVMTTCTVQQI